MIVLTAAVLGVNLGIFAALYWRQLAQRRREQRRRCSLLWPDAASKTARRLNLSHEPPPPDWPFLTPSHTNGRSLTDRLRWYTLR